MNDDTIYKIAIAAYLHDIGKFAERTHAQPSTSGKLSTGFFPDDVFINANMGLYLPDDHGKYTHRHAVYTAAFIDHIEEFLPGQFNRGEWGLGDSFENLAAGHHKPETPMQWVIAIADRVSSGFDRDEFEDYNKGIGVKDFKKTRMLTIAEGIRTGGKWLDDNPESYRFRYALKELSPENIFAVDAKDNVQSEKEYSDLFFSFVSALGKLSHKKNIHLWFEHFDSLFMIYASHIPAATVGKVVPDVSLYDHSKTAAAIASALYLYHRDTGTLQSNKIQDYDENKFLIVSGDFYGIQNFIFAEGGSTNKATAKLLRGRSFSVSLISELAADMLCKAIGLTTISIVLSAAGKFTVIAPNTDDAKNKMKSVEGKINDWLMKMFYGEASIGISFIEASCNDFTTERFSNLWERLAKELERKKYNKVNLDSYGGAVTGYLDQFNNNLSKKLCPFCGRRPSHADMEIGDEILSACNICRDHIYIGTNIVKAEKIAITTKDAEIYGAKLKEPIFGEYQISLDVEGKLGSLADKGDLLKYWDISISKDGNIAKDITAKFINGYVPVYDDSDQSDDRYFAGRQSEKKKAEIINQIRSDKDEKVPKTFAHLTKKALNFTDKPNKFTGIEALGILKADVDNLGLIFSCGLRRTSISRLATLSRQMNNFFSIYLPYLMGKKDEFKNIYTVFAGGDDLFLIGPWNRIIDFASFLNTEFRRYVCGNSEITISAGISLNKPGEPVSTIYKFAEEALKKAKGDRKNERDRITLFDETVKWDKFNELNAIKDTILKWQEDKFINNAILFRFNTFTELAKQEKDIKDSKFNIQLEDMECLKLHAKFRYNLVRNVGRELKGEGKDATISEVEKAAEWFRDNSGAMKIPVWQIIYNQR